MRLELAQPDEDDEEQRPNHRYGGRTWQQRMRFRPRTRAQVAEWNTMRLGTFGTYGEWHPPTLPLRFWQRWLLRAAEALEDLVYGTRRWPQLPRFTSKREQEGRS